MKHISNKLYCQVINNSYVSIRTYTEILYFLDIINFQQELNMDEAYEAYE